VRSPEHIPDDNVVEYYMQRASDGGLLISEATHISVMVLPSIQQFTCVMIVVAED
jgi:2,4-dienoyl-CoA reductase-like NADH-dependent reductase (Old Yellow Enzyme family)